MISAPDVFTTGPDGTYTSDVAVDWVAHHGTPSPLFIGRTLRYTAAAGWEIGPATADAKAEWKPISEAPKALRAAFNTVEFAPAQDGLYELIGPKIAKNPHGLDEPLLAPHGMVPSDDAGDFVNVATTSLWALARNWFPATRHPGILWTWDDSDTGQVQYAAVRRDRMPDLES